MSADSLVRTVRYMPPPRNGTRPLLHHTREAILPSERGDRATKPRLLRMLGAKSMKITRRRFAAGSLAVAGASTLARPALADTSPIVIGYPAALTGPSSAPGVGNNRGVVYAVQAINDAGGGKGRKIEVLTRDTQGDPTKAVNAVQEMMGSATVHAIWGPNNS